MSKEPREYFEEKCAARINEIKAELDELEYSAENVPWDPGADESREIENLRIQLQDVEKKLHELRASGDSSWPLIRAEMETALSVLGRSVSRKLSQGKE
jgi:hypothetical protein